VNPRAGAASLKGRKNEPQADDDRFSEPIRARFAELDLIVERLTTDQKRVIDQLGDQQQALISGCAGSGKTLVATEKALRLAHAGVATLFLCHNPLLADWVSELTVGRRVRVRAFEDLLSDLTGVTGAPVPAEWTSYSQPTPDMLDLALERLMERGGTFGAVIVDEGQDFHPDWWPVVEACLRHDDDILYIFFDDCQALLPLRSRYPIADKRLADKPLDLSRNCRNAGRVYELMSGLAPLNEPPEDALSNRGDVVLIHSGPGMLRRSVEACLDWLYEHGAVDGVAAVLGGGVHFAGSVLHSTTLEYGPALDWRSAVRHEFLGMARQMGPTFRGSRLRELHQLLDSLSANSRPTQVDREVVAQAAALVTAGLSADVPRHPSGEVEWRATSHGTGAAGGPHPRLHPRGPSTFPYYALQGLHSGRWAPALPARMTATFAPHNDAAAGAIPVYSVGEIKGLEREAVLLVMQGEPPQPIHELFVGVSRARSLLAVALDEHAYRTIPPRIRKRVASPSLLTSSA
jgi:hypothetical protein